MSNRKAAARQPALSRGEQLLELATGYWRSRALAVAAELEIADHLANGPLHVDELAARTQTHARSLFRLLRALESVGVFRQVEPRLFANSQLSEALRKSVPGSQWAGIRLAFSTGGGEFEAWGDLRSAVATGQIAFDHINGYNWWEFLKRNPEKHAIFGEAMRSYTAAVTPTVTAAYDWSRFPVIADIGGGIGTQLVDILNAYPICSGILLDQTDVIAQAIRHERVERVVGSFFERVPAGTDAYILRSVIHDWADSQAIMILKTIRLGAKPGSRVIIIEQLINETPDYALNKWLDLLMLVVSGGQERTTEEYRQLLNAAKLDVEAVVSTAGPFSLIVSRPRN
jgi:O-methyltransferase domain/Dimerisation domain